MRLRKILPLRQNQLLSGGIVMIAGTNFASFIAYLFHLVLGRLLGPIRYADLAAFISMSGIFAAAFAAMSTVLVKFISTEKDKQIKYLISWINRVSRKISIVVFISLLILSPFISQFLKVDLNVILLLPVLVILLFYAAIYRSYLQGLINFVGYVVSVNVDSFLRLILAVVLVLAGLGVFGASLSFIIGLCIGIVVCRMYLSSYLGIFSGKYKNSSQLLKYALPVFVMSIAITSFFTSDVILVKHFFEAHQAGIYSSLSTLGKIIIFGTAPISAVMFPIVAKRHSINQRSPKVFLSSLFMVLLISGFVLTIFYFFPTQSVLLLFGNKFLEASNYLFTFGLFSVLVSLNSLFIYFYLSVNKTKAAYIIPMGAIFQVGLISLNHATLVSVIYSSIISLLVLLVAQFLYGIYVYKHYFSVSKMFRL